MPGTNVEYLNARFHLGKGLYVFLAYSYQESSVETEDRGVRRAEGVHGERDLRVPRESFARVVLQMLLTCL